MALEKSRIRVGWQKSCICLLPLLLMVLVFSCEKSTVVDPPPKAPLDSLEQLRRVMTNPATCGTCHPNHYSEWQTSMHAYAFEDPIFQKLNQLAQQRSNNAVDQFCIKCHAPVGSALGDLPAGFDPGAQSGFNIRRGIHCDVCHTANEMPRGRGIESWHLDNVRRSTIADPKPNAFHESAFKPEMSFSNFCAACHDIEAPSGTFLLEATNTEWDNSAFAGMGIECQSCHMPAYQGPAADGGEERTVHRHTFVGVDYPLIDFPGKNETIESVRALLENSVSLQVNVPNSVSTDSIMTVSVKITNSLTGHNIPSGATFERQMWIELIATDQASGDTVFATGTLDANGDLRNHHSSLVSSGVIEADSNLVLYRGVPRDTDGNELLFFWEASQVEFRTIPAFASRTSDFQFRAPSQAGTLDVSVRLRFRPLPPYFLRKIDEADLIPELRIFEMESLQQTVPISAP